MRTPASCRSHPPGPGDSGIAQPPLVNYTGDGSSRVEVIGSDKSGVHPSRNRGRSMIYLGVGPGGAVVKAEGDSHRAEHAMVALLGALLVVEQDGDSAALQHQRLYCLVWVGQHRAPGTLPSVAVVVRNCPSVIVGGTAAGRSGSVATVATVGRKTKPTKRHDGQRYRYHCTVQQLATY